MGCPGIVAWTKVPAPSASRQLRMGGIQARYGITAPILVLSANVATYGAGAPVCDMELEATTSPKCDMELGNEIPNPSSPPLHAVTCNGRHYYM